MLHHTIFYIYEKISNIQGGPKNRLFFRVTNFTTFNGRKVCNMSKVSNFYLEKQLYLHFSAFEYSSLC